MGGAGVPRRQFGVGTTELEPFIVKGKKASVHASSAGRVRRSRAPLEPVEPNYRGEVARRYRYRDGSGEIGIVASVTQPFCRGCTRARLSADGELFTCLFAARGHDLRSVVRSDANDVQIGEHIRAVWHVRADRYSELRSAQTEGLGKVEMSYIGG